MSAMRRAYVSGFAAAALRYETIADTLADAGMRHGDRVAVIDAANDRRATFADIVRASDEVAAGLLSLGIDAGERVALWSPNRLDWVVIEFAIMKIGAILVTVNSGLGVAELEYEINKVGCKALIFAGRCGGHDAAGMIAELAPELAGAVPGKLAAKRLKALRWVIGIDAAPTGGLALAEVIERGRIPACSAALIDRVDMLQPDDPINIQFTSGTAGFSRAATLTHLALLNNAVNATAHLGLEPGDRVGMPMPLHHCFGLVLGSLACLVRGATLVLCGERPTAERILPILERERCTALACVPTILAAVLDSPVRPTTDLGALKSVLVGGAGVNPTLLAQAETALNLDRLIASYGIAETGPVCFQTLPDDPVDRRHSGIGRVLPHLEAKIIDPQGRALPVGASGELVVRGFSNMRGYWNDDTRTKETVDPAGWLKTGDLAVIDAQGYAAIVGRVKDLVMRDGEAIYPREIEEFLYRHPQIQEVAVFGVPDPKLGEDLCAFIQPRVDEALNEAEIRRFCAGQIADSKIPRYIRFVPDLPMSVAGDVMKSALRDRLIAEIGGR